MMKFYLCGFLLIVSLSSLGGPIELFDNNGGVSNNYTENIARLRPNHPHAYHAGDTITFPNGKTYIFKRYLGEGHFNIVIEIGKGKALRLLKGIPEGLDKESNPIQWTLDGELALKRYKIPHVKIYSQNESIKSPYYLIVEKLDFDFDLYDFLSFRFDPLNEHNPHYHKLNQLSPEQMDEALNQLVEFAKKVFMFKRIGDLHSGNIVFHQGQWKLLDWTDDHQLATKQMSEHPFDSIYFEMPVEFTSQLREKIGHAIKDLRESKLDLTCEDSLYDQLLFKMAHYL